MHENDVLALDLNVALVDKNISYLARPDVFQAWNAVKLQVDQMKTEIVLKAATIERKEDTITMIHNVIAGIDPQCDDVDSLKGYLQDIARDLNMNDPFIEDLTDELKTLDNMLSKVGELRDMAQSCYDELEELYSKIDGYMNYGDEQDPDDMRLEFENIEYDWGNVLEAADRVY